MGGCLGGTADNRLIERRMQGDRQSEFLVKKLLLLGSGGSGKSTIFKQLKTIHGDGLNDSEKAEHVDVIRMNLVGNMKLLVRKAQELSSKKPEEYGRCEFDMDNEELVEAIERLEMCGEDAQPDEPIVNSIRLLWHTPQIQYTWDNRNVYPISESASYFFDEIDRVSTPDYQPTQDDLLRARVRTTGIIHTEFVIGKHTFQIFDVGGQRNERKKWIHCFENVTAVIFVAALDSFCRVLFEDEHTNAMEESLGLFENICNSKWFRQTEMILFLNKTDLFVDRLREGTSICHLFPEYTGANFDNTREFVDENEELEYTNIVFTESVDYIQEQYTQRNHNKDKVVFAHPTQATDRGNVEKVFWDVQNIVIRSNLRRAQLL